jgi:hypothetical protein
MNFTAPPPRRAPGSALAPVSRPEATQSVAAMAL